MHWKSLTATLVAMSFLAIGLPAQAKPPAHGAALQRQEEKQEKVDKRERRQEKRHEKQHEKRHSRVSRHEQQKRIQGQQQGLVQYRRHLDERQRVGREHIARLKIDKRVAQQRFQQDYVERLRRQQIRINSARNYDYANDPYFFTAPTHRYLRGGTYYQTNQHGVDWLRRAVNSGYGQGVRVGAADLEDRWTSRYQDSYVYQDANYGYDGRHLDRDEYNHYFREGFRRGYDDGYGSRHQYGTFSGGQNSMLGEVLSAILSFQSLP